MNRTRFVGMAAIAVALHATATLATAAFSYYSDTCRSTKYFEFGEGTWVLDCTYAGCNGQPQNCAPRVITPTSGNPMRVCNCAEGGALDSCCQVVEVIPSGQGAAPYPDVEGDCVPGPCPGSGVCTMTPALVEGVPVPGTKYVAECLPSS